MAEGSAVAIQAYLNLNGVVWKLMEDGSLVPLEPGEAVLPDVPLLEFPDSNPGADPASSSSQSSLASFFTNVSRDGAGEIPSSGYDTRGVADAGGSSRDAKHGPPPDLLPNDAGISIQKDTSCGVSYCVSEIRMNRARSLSRVCSSMNFRNGWLASSTASREVTSSCM